MGQTDKHILLFIGLISFLTTLNLIFFYCNKFMGKKSRNSKKQKRLFTSVNCNVTSLHKVLYSTFDEWLAFCATVAILPFIR